MIWADRIGVPWALFVLGLMGFTGLTFISTFVTVLWIAGPWFVCRLLDFICTGSIRLPGEVRQEVLPPL